MKRKYFHGKHSFTTSRMFLSLAGSPVGCLLHPRSTRHAFRPLSRFSLTQPGDRVFADAPLVRKSLPVRVEPPCYRRPARPPALGFRPLGTLRPVVRVPPPGEIHDSPYRPKWNWDPGSRCHGCFTGGEGFRTEVSSGFGAATWPLGRCSAELDPEACGVQRGGSGDQELLDLRIKVSDLRFPSR